MLRRHTTITMAISALINSTSPSDRNIIGHVRMPTYLATSAVAYSASRPKKPTHNRKAPLQSLPVEDVFARFHLDHLGPLPPSVTYLLLYPEIHLTKSCDADETAKVLYKQVFCRYGCLLSVLTDRGSDFRASLVKALCKLRNVKQIFTSSFHPSTNSRAVFQN